MTTSVSKRGAHSEQREQTLSRLLQLYADLICVESLTRLSVQPVSMFLVFNLNKDTNVNKNINVN